MRKIIIAALLFAGTIPAFAWPACSGNWVQVAKGTKSAPGAGGIGAVVVENGQTFECEKPSGGGSSKSSVSSSTASSVSSAQSASSASSGASSDSSATLGPISVKSGDSTNTNLANGGQGGAGGNANQQQTATSTGGNNSNNTTVNEAKIPVNTAYAPTALPTMGCFKGFGAGAQTSGFGASFGGGKVDENCEILEVARSLGVAGSWDAYCQVMVTNKYAKKAGVTWDECMKRVTEAPAPVAVVPTAPQPAPAPQIIYIEPPASTASPVDVHIFTPVTPSGESHPDYWDGKSAMGTWTIVKPAKPAPATRKKKPAVQNCPAVK